MLIEMTETKAEHITLTRPRETTAMNKRKSLPDIHAPDEDEPNNASEPSVAEKSEKRKKTKKQKVDVPISQPQVNIRNEIQRQKEVDTMMDDTRYPKTPTPSGSSITKTPETFPPLDKGKGKAKAVTPEQPADSDDEDSDMGFEILTISKATMGSAEPGRAYNLVTSFERPIYAYHRDHMAPFRGIIADFRDEPAKASAEITNLFKENKALKLLMATSGKK
jgi:hypothetical protein